MGFVRAGFAPLWFIENDPHASAVLDYHFPYVRNYGDITKVNESELAAPDVFWMSPPCQDLSVAGKRKGLVGERSGLFYDGIRIAKHLVRNGTRYVCMEQVPGLFSANGGEDFRRVLSELWELGPIDFGWRVLDSQYAHVAQRRERAFFVLDFGGKGVAEILSFPDGMSGHPAPRREKGSRVAATLASGSAGSSNQPGRRCEDDFNIIPEVSRCLSAQPQLRHDHTLDTLIPEVSRCLRASCGDSDPDIDTYIPVAFPIQDSREIEKGQNGTGIGTDLSPAYTLDQTGSQAVALVVNARQDPIVSEDVSQPIDTDGSSQAVQVQWASGGGQVENDTAQALRSNAEHSYQFIRQGFQIRRLTPRECERLQGWPDDWTRYGSYNGVVKEISGTQRYKMIGNGVTSTISEMLARKILEVSE